jgi:outer membrane lipoprotein-sorting protein
MLNLPKKIILYFGLINSVLFGIELPTDYKCNFQQTIQEKKNNKIQYNGILYYENKKNIKWKYLEPISKEIIIKNNKIFIIEPDLEQVIIKKNNSNKNIFSLLKTIKKNNIKNFKYKLINDNIEYNILFNKQYIPIEIKYIDTLDNNINIKFFNLIYNMKNIQNQFDFFIPDDYDIITN